MCELRASAAVSVCFRVLQLMNLTDSRLAQAGCEKLDLALISFFEQFRKIYVGDQVQKTSKVRLPSCHASSSLILHKLKAVILFRLPYYMCISTFSSYWCIRDGKNVNRYILLNVLSNIKCVSLEAAVSFLENFYLLTVISFI